MTDRSRRQRGFSLIELMIAMLLGIIVVAGLIQLLISNRTAYRLQEGNNFLQQNLRYATDRIDWSVRMADFWGGTAAKDIVGIGNNVPGTGCDTAFMINAAPSATGGGVFGYDGATGFPIASCLASAANYVPGSDVLVVRYADTDPCTLTGTAFTTVNCLPASRYYLTSAVGQGAAITAGTGGGTAATIAGATTQLYVYPLRTEVYYLAPCSDPGTGGVCSATSDGGTPVPTLMHMRIDSGQTTLKAEPLVEGIEQLQFEYGISDATAPYTNLVTQWKRATDLNASSWAQVIAVRVSMVARGRQRDVSVPQASDFVLNDGCEYKIAVGGAFTLTTGTNCTGFTLAGLNRPDQFPRKMIQQVVMVRNRVRVAKPTTPPST